MSERKEPSHFSQSAYARGVVAAPLAEYVLFAFIASHIQDADKNKRQYIRGKLQEARAAQNALLFDVARLSID